MCITCTQGTRDTPDKDGLPRVQRLRAVHYKVAVVQVPGPDLDLQGLQRTHTKKVLNNPIQSLNACRHCQLADQAEF